MRNNKVKNFITYLKVIFNSIIIMLLAAFIIAIFVVTMNKAFDDKRYLILAIIEAGIIIGNIRWFLR